MEASYRGIRVLPRIFVCLYIIEQDQIWEKARFRFSLSYKTVNLRLACASPWSIKNNYKKRPNNYKTTRRFQCLDSSPRRLMIAVKTSSTILTIHQPAVLITLVCEEGGRCLIYQWGSNYTFTPNHESQNTHGMHKHWGVGLLLNLPVWPIWPLTLILTVHYAILQDISYVDDYY